jgi:osmotically-inducible protein OsmY
MYQRLIGMCCLLAAAACDSNSTPDADRSEGQRSTTDQNVNAPNRQVSDAPKQADNTGLNERDRDGALTPPDQGSSDAETTITAAIRRELTDHDTLSFNAKNAKVITTGAKVTLRGPVATAEEKSTVEAIAKRTAGVKDVDNQLEVTQ